MTQRILFNTSATLTRTFYVDGNATDADGDVSVTLTDEAGDTVVASTPATSQGSGVYTYLLAPQSQLNRLTASWAGEWSTVSQSFNDRVEIVGGHLFTETEARDVFDGTFSAAAVFTDAAIATARDRISDRFEEICGVSFVPRYERERLTAAGTMLHTRRPKVLSIIGCTDQGSAVTAGNLTPDPLLPRVYRTAGTFLGPSIPYPLNVTLEYTHGHDSVPGAIRRAALTVLRHELLPDEQGGSIPDRMLSLTNEFGNMRVDQPGIGRLNWYGIPSVNQTLREYRLVLAVA